MSTLTYFMTRGNKISIPTTDNGAIPVSSDPVTEPSDAYQQCALSIPVSTVKAQLNIQQHHRFLQMTI